MTNQATTEAEKRALARMNGDSGLVTHEERERRLLFIAEKMADGMSRRLLVDMAMTCFRVGRRAAQKYVAAAERRLHNRAARLSPLFAYELSRTQRDKLLECVFQHTNTGEELEPKVLVELVNAANRVLDSRDRATAMLFQLRDAGNRTPARVSLQVNSIHAEAGMLRAAEGEPCLEAATYGDGRALPGPRSRLNLPPEIMARTRQKIADGATPEEAVDLVLAELRAEAASKSLPANGLQQDEPTI
jgi:uncharacterized protein YoaH (UPF0181 family)